MHSADRIAELRKQHYNATITYFHRANDELAIVRVRPDFPIPPHKAGQYTTLGIGFWEPRVEGCQEEELEQGQEVKLVKRAYSLSSSILNSGGELLRPEEEDALEVYVVLVRTADRRAPALTPRLFAMAPGDRLHVGEKITGHYTLDLVRPGDTVLMLATGTGEAPHNKMTLELLRRGHTGTIASVVCVRYERDLGYRDVHARLTARFPNYRYITLTTREEKNRGRKVYIQDLIRTGQLEAELGRPLDPATTHVYLCGNPQMIGAPHRDKSGQLTYPQPTGVTEILESRGFRGDRPREPGNVHFELYW